MMTKSSLTKDDNDDLKTEPTNDHCTSFYRVRCRNQQKKSKKSREKSKQIEKSIFGRFSGISEKMSISSFRGIF
jgi:hypothetical protein